MHVAGHLVENHVCQENYKVVATTFCILHHLLAAELRLKICALVILQIIFQETIFFQIASLIAECVVLESAVVLPDKSLHAAYFTLKELELSIPINGGPVDASDRDGPFTGVRLCIAGFMMAKSPFLNFRTLELDKDPGCHRIWKGNPVDSSHQR